MLQGIGVFPTGTAWRRKESEQGYNLISPISITSAGNRFTISSNKAAQCLRGIQPVLISHVNIKKHKVKPFLPGCGKEIRATVKTVNCGVKKQASKLRL